jgi:hypothetical protein
MDRDVDLRTVSFERFIYRVINQLLHHMMEPGAIVRVTNIHAWALPNRLQAL